MTIKTLPLMAADARVVENMPFAAYAAAPGLNGSKIVNMRRSPLYFRYCVDNPQPPTPALTLGVYTHRLILEPTRVGDFAVWGSEDGHYTEKGKIRPRNGGDWDAYRGAHSHQDIITKDECEAMVGMAVSVRKSLPIRRYADAPGPTELSLFWTDSVTGRKFKCRLDKWIPKTSTVFDLKTTRCCQPFKFGAQAYQLQYHVKMAIQWLGVKACFDVDASMKLGAIESKAPHESAVYRITSDVKLQGLEELDALVKILDECEKTNNWPAEMEVESDLLLPAWATPNEDNEDLVLEGLETE